MKWNVDLKVTWTVSANSEQEAMNKAITAIDDAVVFDGVGSTFDIVARPIVKKEKVIGPFKVPSQKQIEKELERKRIERLCQAQLAAGRPN